MAQWGVNDQADNSVLWGPTRYGKDVTAANRNDFFGNTTADAYVSGITVGQFGVSADEVNTSNTASEAFGGKIAHTGWTIRTEGSGGRAGRVTYETIVAGGISGDAVSDDPLLGDD
jgi:hypothetical protein